MLQALGREPTARWGNPEAARGPHPLLASLVKIRVGSLDVNRRKWLNHFGGFMSGDGRLEPWKARDSRPGPSFITGAYSIPLAKTRRVQFGNFARRTVMGILFALIVLVILFAIFLAILGEIEIEPPYKKIIKLVVLLVFVILLFGLLLGIIQLPPAFVIQPQPVPVIR
jgi:hypothetical protein